MTAAVPGGFVRDTPEGIDGPVPLTLRPTSSPDGVQDVGNFLLAHGRRAFRGDRRILVAMA